MVIIGIESSCDETAVALVEEGKRVLSSEVASQQDIFALYGGVVPELASRQHLEVIVPLFRLSLQRSGTSLLSVNAVAATVKPGLSGSLLIGENFGRAVAQALEVPFLPVDHLEAHLAVNFLSGLPHFPALGLVISGGHSSLFFITGPNQFEILGDTRDDAAGEAFDKVARLLSLPYPGGPPLERLAASAKEKIHFPVPFVRHSYDFSFSGLKTAVAYYLKENPGADKASVAAGFQEAVAQALVRKLDYAFRQKKVKTVLTGGGVMANKYLREKLAGWAEARGVNLKVPEASLSLDNGVMVAVRGYYLLSKNWASN